MQITPIIILIGLLINKIISMKRIFLLPLFLSVFSSAYAQEDLIKKVAEQAVEISELKKDIQNYNSDILKFQNLVKIQQDTLKKTKADLAKLENYKADIKITESRLQQKNDSIASLKSINSEKDKQIISEKQNGNQKAIEEKEKGRNEVLANIINSYKSRTFDDLMVSSTKLSVQHDMQLVGHTAEINPLLSDLKVYFNAKETLEKKYDPIQNKYAQNQLSQIKRESASLDNLTRRIGNYQMFNQGLKEAIEKINSLDQRETVAGMPEEIQKQKFNKIISQISPYIFNYDFNFLDYPYLSDILIELIKRKQPDPDADITDLLKKLN
jgi:hypothetical protein